MGEIKVYKKINAVNPVMIAGWPGMGNVALGVVEYLKKKLKTAVKFCEIRIDKLSLLDSVIVEGGVAAIPEAPKNTFYHYPQREGKNPDIIIFEGEAQLPGEAGVVLLNEVLDVAVKYKPSRIYTGAAFALPISHKEPSELYAAVNNESLKNVFAPYEVKLMEEGHISGLNGLMLGFAKERAIEAVCLLATMPQYAISLPNPKASSAIIEVLQKILNFEIDLRELDEFTKEMDEKMAAIEDKVKDVFTVEKEEKESRPPEKKIPAYVMERIEKLFREAKTDKSRAVTLKNELDRWDLYKLYEDRFLDLFKEP